MIFEVLGNPMGKQRARTLRNGHSYTPEKTVNYETLIKLSCPKLYAPLVGALNLAVIAYYPIPKSFSKTKREQALQGHIRPLVKPDIDNVIKIVCDALNGIAYKDDTQISTVWATKKYGEQPKIIIQITEDTNK